MSVRQMIAFAFCLLFFSCNKFKEINQPPEIEPLQQGLKTSVAIAYCASVATSAYKGRALPGNVVFDKNTGFIYIKIDKNHPLPFNSNIGDIVVSGLWRNGSGVMAVLFANIDLLGGKVKLYGLHLVPFFENLEKNRITAVFAKQDIILGNGSDTILNLSNISDFVFNAQMDRLNTEKATDVFIAVKQNVWMIDIDQANTDNNVYDDNVTISGGGQIVEVEGSSGGMIYHAMIDALVNYSICSKNPISGCALSQNFKAGGNVLLDLGNSYISFRNNCDGKGHVDFCSGKYVMYNGKDINLNLY
jgi:hypothetical protein